MLQRQTTQKPETTNSPLFILTDSGRGNRLAESHAERIVHQEITTDTLEILIRTNVDKMVNIYSKVKVQKDEDHQFLTESKLKKYEQKNRKMSGLNMHFNYGDEAESLRKPEQSFFGM